MRNDYNLIAPLYDVGVKVLFGKGVYHSYFEHLDRITGSERVLIVGGGTGLLLSGISPQAEIDYVELSGGMIKQAKKQRSFRIHFHKLDFESFDTELKYDWIVFPYFLDLFTRDEIKSLLSKSKRFLKPTGHLIVSDFDIPKTFLHRSLIFFSIVSLRLIVSLRITRLAPILDILKSEGFQTMERKAWNNGFIFSAIFRYRETLR